MTLTRLLVGVVVALVIVLLALFFLILPSSTYQVKAIFQDSGELVEGNYVMVGGHPVGTISHIGLNGRNEVEVDMSITEDDLSPLHAGTVATIRIPSISGIANHYISLAPGPSNAPTITDGGVIEPDFTVTAVAPDELLDTFDEPTREGIRQVVQQAAVAFNGREADVAQANKYLSPFLGEGVQVMEEILADHENFRRLVADSGRLMSALSSRSAELASLVRTGNTTASAIADQSAALSTALDELPPTLRQANTTFVNLRAALDDVQELMGPLRVASPDMVTVMRRAQPLLKKSGPVVRDMRRAISKKGANNDMTDVLNTMPAVAEAASDAFPDTEDALAEAQPMLDFLRPYTPDLTGWFTAFGDGVANYDALGHYARLQPLSFNFSIVGGVYEPVDVSQRSAGLAQGIVNRCPGAASQATADGSAPFFEDSPACDPSIVPAGP